MPNKDIVFSPSRLQEAMGGMSMVDLAEKLGCAKSNISMYLSGQRNVEASGPTTPLDRELVELLPLLTEDQKQLLLAQIKVALGNK